MKIASKFLRCLVACVLVVGLLPATSFASQVDVVADVTADEDYVQGDQAQDAETNNDASDINSPNEASVNSDAQTTPLGDGVQDDVAILEEGDFGENNALHWTYRDDASLTISGIGKMPDYTQEGKQPWASKIPYIEKVIIEKGIIHIGSYSFAKADMLEDAEIADSVETMGSHIFDHCTALGCKNDSVITIPDSVKTIGSHTFYWCESLKKCVLPSGLTEIPESMFERSNVDNVVLPQTLEKIGTSAFKEGGIDVISSEGIPSSVKIIESKAFYQTKWKRYLCIPGSAQTIGSQAFAYISFLNEDSQLVISEGLTSSQLNNVFNQTGAVYNIVLPSSFDSYSASLLPWAFHSYEVAESNSNFASVDGVLFGKKSMNGKTYDDKMAVLLKQPKFKQGDYVIPDGVIEVSENSISNSVTSIKIPVSLEFFRDKLPSTSNVARFEVAEGSENFCSIDDILFYKDMTRLVRCPPKKTMPLNYVVPNGVKVLSSRCFDHCLTLSGLCLPSSIQALETECVNYCSALAVIYLPSSKMNIYPNAIANSTSTGRRGGINVVYGGTADDWTALKITQNTLLQNADKFYNCVNGGVTKDGQVFRVTNEGLLGVTKDNLASEPSLKIGDYESDNQEWASYKPSIKQIEIGEFITDIGAKAFYGCQNLEGVFLPYELVKIGDNAFSNSGSSVNVDCLGNPFEVQAAGSAKASFGSDICIHYKANYASNWLSDSGYDEDTSKWMGYIITEDDALDMPTISRIELSRTKLQAKGYGQDYHDPEIEITYSVFDSNGKDVTDYVDIEVIMPEQSVPTAHLDGGVWAMQEHLRQCSIDSDEHRINFPRCGAAGEYVVRATPYAGKFSGGAVEKAVTLTRAPETVYGVESVNAGLYGKIYPGEYQTYSFDVWNQYADTVLDKVTVSVFDQYTGEDVTKDTQSRGFVINADKYQVSFDPYTLPSDYRVAVKANNPGLSGSREGKISIGRDARIINQPYTITLSGGNEEILVSHADQWARTPYHVKAVDAYNDPVWPELGWTIYDAKNNDVTNKFFIDEQGYLQISQAVMDKLSVSSQSSFKIKTDADGIISSGDNNLQNFYPSIVKSKIESNELIFSLALDKQTVPITHTATFKVGSDVIGEVVFEEGDTSLVEPILPPKENYIGEWEEYDLATKTSDFVVQGVYSPMDPDKVSEVGGSTDASYENGLVTINLSATSSTKNIKVESSATKPVDVVMVLDRSGSMKNDGKLQKLKSCATQFAQSLYENAVKTGADHRVALVGFAYGAYGDTPYKNTGLMTTQNGGEKNYKQIASAGCSDALLPINNGGSINNKITNAINKMSVEGATAADAGLEIAKCVFADNPITPDSNGVQRERLVLFVTDGRPTTYFAENRSQVNQAAAGAISMANLIKNGQGARIYSVGVDPTASASAAFNSSVDGVILDRRQQVSSYDFNRFLHAVSSNYPSAAAMNNLGSGDKSAGYYLAANNISLMDGIFTNILYSNIYNTQAFDKATLSYTLPQGLVLTLKNEEDMRASLAGQGIASEDIQVIRENGKTRIVVHNVNVKREVVNGITQYRANISFQVSVDNGVTGSIKVGENAVIEVGGQNTELNIPTVQIPSDRRLIVFKINGEIYEIRDAEVGDTITVPDTDIARWLDLEKQVNPTIKESDTYVVFETSTLTRTYDMRWIVGDVTTREPHGFGEELTVSPYALAAIPEGMEISHWSPSLPQTMPAHDVTCTAVLTPIHTHSYTASTYISGSCESGVVIHNVCACGEEQTSQQAPTTHAYQAHLDSAGEYGTTVQKLVCDNCGHTVNKNISYKVIKNSYYSGVTVLDLEKTQNQVIQSGPSSDDISIRFFVGFENNGTYKVYRVDEDGYKKPYNVTVKDGYKKPYNVTVKDGYLTFDPDHFSIYVIGEIDDENNDPAENITIEDVEDFIENADLPPVIEGEDDGPNGPGTGGNSGSGSGNNGGSTSGGGGGGGAIPPTEDDKTDADGITTVEETEPDGTKHITMTDTSNGCVSAIEIDPSGKTTIDVDMPEEVAKEASAGVQTRLPLNGVYAEKDISQAPELTLKACNEKNVLVDIPIVNKGINVVAVLQKPDGSTSVIKNTVPTDDGIAVRLDSGDTVKIIDNAKSFDDIEGHWGTESIGFASSRELFNGTGPATFAPDIAMSRAMMVTVIARYEGVDTDGGSIWYEKGADWAHGNGIFNGTRLDDDLTRQEMVQMLYRYAKRIGKADVSLSNVDMDKYTDVKDISDWAQESMGWAVNAGLIKGTSPTTLSPHSKTTRAEVATVFMRLACL